VIAGTSLLLKYPGVLVKVMVDHRPPLSERVDGATSILVLAPSPGKPDEEACIDFLAGSDPGGRNVLSVTVSETPEDRLALWHRRVGEALPEQSVIVAAGEAAGGTEIRTATTSPVTVTALSDPIDPFELVSAISGYLGRWEDSPDPTTVCMHSLTTLFDRLYATQVLHVIDVLNARFADADAVAHYHLDPGGFDRTGLGDLHPLFDAVVEHGADGEWTVTRPEGPPPRFRNEPAPDFADPEAETREAGPDSKTRKGDPPSLSHSFDTVLDILGAPQRRAMLYYLASIDADRVALDTLVSEVRALSPAVGEGDWGDSERGIEISLLHVHLPKLEALEVIELDREEEVVRYNPNPALEASVEEARRIEDV